MLKNLHYIYIYIYIEREENKYWKSQKQESINCGPQAKSGVS